MFSLLSFSAMDSFRCTWLFSLFPIYLRPFHIMEQSCQQFIYLMLKPWYISCAEHLGGPQMDPFPRGLRPFLIKLSWGCDSPNARIICLFWLLSPTVFNSKFQSSVSSVTSRPPVLTTHLLTYSVSVLPASVSLDPGACSSLLGVYHIERSSLVDLLESACCMLLHCVSGHLLVRNLRLSLCIGILQDFVFNPFFISLSYLLACSHLSLSSVLDLVLSPSLPAGAWAMSSYTLSFLGLKDFFKGLLSYYKELGLGKAQWPKMAHSVFNIS